MLVSCAPRISSGVKGDVPPLPIALTEGQPSQKYNFQLDFLKHHFSGLLMARRMSAGEIRIVMSTYFGLTLFDVSFVGAEFRVNNCVEPLRRKKMLKLLEADFRRLFLPGKEGYRTSAGSNTAEHLILRHPWIRLTIRLDQLTN
jgi:hypothetical protein